MKHDVGLDRRYLDLVVFADQIARLVGRNRAAIMLAGCRRVIPKRVGIVRQPPIVRFMPELRPAGPGVLALLLLVRRGRLGRGARTLVGTLKPKHQLNQLLPAELLQITPVHLRMDSEIAALSKGWVIAAPQRPLGGVVGEAGPSVFEEARERRPTGRHVVHGLGDGGVTGQFCALGAQPYLRRDDERSRGFTPRA